jgi:hypothetical protein
MTIFKTTAPAGREILDTVTLETSPHRDHFDFIADCLLWKYESRSQFFGLLAAMIDEYQPATFVESSLVATLAAYRWRQFRFCAIFARVTAGCAACEPSGRDALLALLARQERHCKRLYNRTRKLLLEVVSDRVNNIGGRTPPQPPAVAAPKNPRATRSAAAGRGNLRVISKAKLPIAA